MTTGSTEGLSQRIVGDDDGGKLFTPEQYEAYKRKVLPQRVKNRLYVSFGVPGGIDCKLIGPETQCFCTHRYKQHKTDFEVVPSERPLTLPCRVRGCHCPAYQYVPRIGPNPVHCRCKHLPQDHSEATGHLCKKCTSCSGFQSPFTCLCGQASSAHQTLVETKLEREARGQPVGRDVPYAAMGGLIGFSSLLDGYLALEPSGSEQDREDGCQQRCSASWIKETSPKNPSVFTVRERPTNSEMQCPSQSSSAKPNH
ncbi:protein FAM221A isoform X3 [Micropterus salmoides]|uniref:protein FAM221A isoform X3 n=1 Tax=Micropterus salmoides TaxID=27706 RepID=UPI0018ECEF7F|nr:protein FAM221A isoform X3 [Micropterus salmoides]